MILSHGVGRRILIAVALLALPRHGAPGQESPIAYTAGQLNCARFLEIGESKILTEAAGRTRHQTSTRRGTWQFRAAPSAEGMSLEGWLDSLTVTRRSAEVEISPDTDGLIGGRYRGTLSREGEYTAQARPFVPDEVAEVAGMANALEDFFPPLAAKPLKEEEMWTGSAGVTLTRLQDSTSSGTRLQRFEILKHNEARTAPALADTIRVALRQKSVERGRFVWHPMYGLLRRDRAIVVETTVPPGPSVLQAVRSKIEQLIELVRDLRTACAGAGRR